MERNFDRGGERKKNWVRRNEQIRIPTVMVIHDGKNLGVMSNREALQKARDAGLDLVEVAPNVRPPVCHIIDYGKFMFDKQKKEKHKDNAPKEKEVDFKYVISENDLLTKANQIRGFLLKGFKVKCVCKFKGREKAHKDQGFDLFERLITMLEDCAVVEQPPKFEGQNISARLDLKKEVKKDKDGKSQGSASQSA